MKSPKDFLKTQSKSHAKAVFTQPEWRIISDWMIEYAEYVRANTKVKDED